MAALRYFLQLGAFGLQLYLFLDLPAELRPPLVLQFIIDKQGAQNAQEREDEQQDPSLYLVQRHLFTVHRYFGQLGRGQDGDPGDDEEQRERLPEVGP